MTDPDLSGYVKRPRRPIPGPHHPYRVTVRTRTRPMGPADLFIDPDVDYVRTFRELAVLESKLREREIDAPRLVRRSRVTHALGDYRTSAEDAVFAIYLDANNEEAHFRAGVAFLALAALRLGIIPQGPGTTKDPDTLDPVKDILDSARRAFETAARLDHHRAAAGLHATRRLNAIHATRKRIQKVALHQRCR